MDEIIISILVPMYNAETTIEECLTKLLKQCGNTTEVVVLNDGSMPRCWQTGNFAACMRPRAS